MGQTAVLLALASHFLSLSLLAFGGVGAITPEIHRVVVEQQHWLTSKEFTDLYAIGQAAPGPNILVITLIGWKAAGIAGAIVATLAMCTPGALLTLAVLQLWDRFRDNPWRARIQRGIAPITVGLVATTAWLLADLADHNLAGWLITAVSGLVVWRYKLNPLWMLALGALMGALGLV